MESSLEMFKFRTNLDTVFQDDFRLFCVQKYRFLSRNVPDTVSKQKIPFGIALFSDNVIRVPLLVYH